MRWQATWLTCLFTMLGCSLEVSPVPPSTRHSDVHPADGGSLPATDSGSGGGGGGGAAGAHAVGGASGVGAPNAGVDASVRTSPDGALPAQDSGVGVDAAATPAPPGLATCKDFVFKATGACPAQCASCDQGLCNIDCGGVSACNSVTLTCPPGYACAVACTGVSSCGSAKIVCADGPCDVTCTGTSVCQQLRVECGEDACRTSCSGVNAGAMLDLRSKGSCQHTGC